MKTEKNILGWPKQKNIEVKDSDISLKTLLQHANSRFESEAEGFRSNPTDGNSRL
ncbi:MAG: hypothetical protein KJ939_01800 [Nanoarchaeota archaeon]|nr:hypothetical protein [Nanoarchaeota archaeon]MBU4351792.1 hypothetical protein [Nanoarchaeota archaeon]